MTHSTNRSPVISADAVAGSTVWLNAMMPPNAESGSPSQARAKASARAGATAAPHGLLCLTTTAREFAEPAAVVVKHNNPCGAAVAPALADAFALGQIGSADV